MRWSHEDIRFTYEDLSVQGLEKWLSTWKTRLDANPIWNGLDCAVYCGVIEGLLKEKKGVK